MANDTLHKVIANKRLKQLKFLLDSGADVRMTNSLGQSALISALQVPEDSKRWRMFKMLLVRGAVVDAVEPSTGRCALLWASYLQRPPEMKLILQVAQGEVNFYRRDYLGYTALHYTVINNDDQTTKLICQGMKQFGLSVDVPDFDGITAFVHAHRNGNDVITELLKRAGASCRQLDLTAYLPPLGSVKLQRLGPKWGTKQSVNAICASNDRGCVNGIVVSQRKSYSYYVNKSHNQGNSCRQMCQSSKFAYQIIQGVTILPLLGCREAIAHQTKTTSYDFSSNTRLPTRDDHSPIPNFKNLTVASGHPSPNISEVGISKLNKNDNIGPYFQLKSMELSPAFRKGVSPPPKPSMNWVCVLTFVMLPLVRMRIRRAEKAEEEEDEDEEDIRQEEDDYEEELDLQSTSSPVELLISDESCSTFSDDN